MEKRNIDIERRCRQIAKGQRGEGPVVYWMSRDQRVDDNWALLWAQQEAIVRHKALQVVFCLAPDYPETNLRNQTFLVKGLAEVGIKLKSFNIDFKILVQNPENILTDYLRELDSHVLVTDFDPILIKRRWKKKLQQNLHCPLFEIDSHNIIPAWIVSEKKEYAAYTIRPKINRLLDDYLTDIPPLQQHPFGYQKDVVQVQPELLIKKTVKDFRVQEISWIQPGESAAQMAVTKALENRLPNYLAQANNPCAQGQSDLSPYLHYGQLSAQRLSWIVKNSTIPQDDKVSFLEELIVRRELADNFCFYEKNYDQFSCFPEWAQKTLNEHRGDKRDYVYNYVKLDNGKTHEALWNSCQLNLKRTGKLNGYLRMYWAKKILEWTSEPEQALKYAISLNDRYSLDGRDPNGYAGIAWSIGGVHDRAWRERTVFGKVRYMNESGCRRKFDVDHYIKENS